MLTLPPSSSIRNLVDVVFVATLVLVMASFGWTGYLGSDDLSYAEAAEKWLEQAPYVGNTHWSLRYPVVLPIAADFAVLGLSELSLVLPTLLYHFGLLLVCGWTLRQHFDRPTAAIGVVTVACIPLFAIWTTIAFPDVPETFFCLLSLALFVAALDKPKPRAALLASGVAAGLAWLTRESVIFFLLTYVLLFVRGYALPRRRYLLIAAGCFSVVAVESLFLLSATGNAFYRLSVTLRTHLHADPTAGAASVADRLGDMATRREFQVDGIFTATGNLSVSRWFDPILAVLVNQEFMLFYYLAMPLIIWLVSVRRRALTPVQRRWLVPCGLAALVWFAALWAQIGMNLEPRYFMLPTAIAAMIAAVAVRRLLWERSRGGTVLVAATFLSTSALGIYFDKSEPLFGERALASLARSTTEPVYTDPRTKGRGDLLYRIAGVEGRIHDTLPPDGALFLYNPKYVERGSGAQRPHELIAQLRPYRPGPTWEVIDRKQQNRRWPGRLLEWARLSDRVPPELYRRLDRPNPAVTLYRVRDGTWQPDSGSEPSASAATR